MSRVPRRAAVDLDQSEPPEGHRIWLLRSLNVHSRFCGLLRIGSGFATCQEDGMPVVRARCYVSRQATVPSRAPAAQRTEVSRARRRASAGNNPRLFRRCSGAGAFLAHRSAGRHRLCTSSEQPYDVPRWREACLADYREQLEGPKGSKCRRWTPIPKRQNLAAA